MAACRAKRIINLHRRGMEECQAGNLEAAVDKLNRALAEVQKIGLECYQVKIINNLGIVFELMGDEQAAKNHYQTAHGMALAKIGGEAKLSQVVGANLARISLAA